MTREELIQELKFNLCEDCQSFDEIADFILNRERLILEKIGKVLREADKDIHGEIIHRSLTEKYHEAIDSALAIIEKEGGE